MSHENAKYTSDLRDEQWARLESLVVKVKGRGRPVSLSLRAVLNAIFYLLRTGCQWQELPKSYPKHQSVYYHYARWRADGACKR